MVRVPEWLAGLTRRHPTEGPGRDARIWSPADGDAEIRSGEGAGPLWLDRLTLDQLRVGLSLDQPGARLVIEGNGTASFIAADGRPARVEGRLSAGGATLRFEGITRLAFLW